MSKFKRKMPPPKVYDKLWQNPEYDSLRPDKKRLPSPTDKDMFLGTCHIARKMKEMFTWRSWMEDFIDRDGNHLPYQPGKTFSR